MKGQKEIPLASKRLTLVIYGARFLNYIALPIIDGLHVLATQHSTPAVHLCLFLYYVYVLVKLVRQRTERRALQKLFTRVNFEGHTSWCPGLLVDRITTVSAAWPVRCELSSALVGVPLTSDRIRIRIRKSFISVYHIGYIGFVTIKL